ncbi:mechanosensitive ion channel family protein [Haloplanus halophilus]|uniref:mechanosensitive ion channel family protein n=1 Tax=Haloplanus halophilus TaxID=2949993 RepID=UPI00203A9F19|nr:mechanosensitive ion channel family protein [Haloplanus sp. GDY1]
MIDRFVAGLDALPAWQATAVVLAVSLGSALLLELVGVRLARRLTRRTETALDDVVFEELRVPLVVTVALAGVYLLTRVDSVSTTTLVDARTLSLFFGRPSLSIIVLVWARALNRVVNRLVEAVKDRGDRFDFAPVLSNVWTLVVLVGTVAVLLSLWEYDVSPLLAGAGIAGIAVGFAAKDTVANFFGGIALYFDDTYKLGDFVVLDSGESGTVVKVGVRSTTLLTRDEVLVTVPNSVLNATRVTNESAPGRRRRVRVPIGVAYGTDIDAFEELVVELALAESLVLDAPRPRMRLRRFGDSALEYELLAWVNGPTRASRARHELNRAIYGALADADIEIPYPRSDVTVRSAGTAAAADPALDADGGAAGGR